MNEPELVPADAVDLSALAPDDDHWQHVLDVTMARVDRVMVVRESPWSVLARWQKPVLLAAAAATVMLVPVEIGLERRERDTERVHALVHLSNEAVRDGRAPMPEDLLRTFATPVVE